jgi:hypothetical protein
MKDFMEDLARRYSLSMERLPDASVIEICKQSRLTFEVTVPDDVLEWFVVARAGADVVWEDWCDYHPLENDVDEQLRAEMRGDLQRFVAAVIEGHFRVESGALEYFVSGGWSRFEIGVSI